MSASPAPSTLVIKHLHGIEPATFEVFRLSDGKSSEPAKIKSPAGFPVEGRPNSNLLQELKWYLETFLDYPFPPETDHAERVQDALRDWGEQAFHALFDDKVGGRMFDAATKDAYAQLHLQVSSDDPSVLSWPWEALRDPDLGVLGHTCQVERRLNKVYDAQKLPESLPKDRVNILLVVARPLGKQDVGFRSIARALVELIEKENLPAHVELLRPPTFDQLREHLRDNPGFYHIVHFDGHGAYSADAPGGYTFQGAEEMKGRLLFETDDGEPDEIAAEKLTGLLKEHAVPSVVLNACQSAMVSGESKNNDPFASVAMALLRAGMRDVVAMAYSLYVSGAQQFLPAFYKRLFETGSMAVAVRAGRQQMWQHDKRVCARGLFPLQDWLLPVLYRQDPLDFSFARHAAKAAHESLLPDELRKEKDPYGFIGRDSAILELERAMRRKPAGILIQGLGGVGKTTLAKGFLRWLDQTGGLEHPAMWFGFQEIRSAEYVFNRMGEALFGRQFTALLAENPEKTMHKKIELLGEALRENPVVIVWDNFESAAGIEGTSIAANLPENDRKLLAQFLDGIRGGKSKVIITSRSAEDWLGPQKRVLLPLGGMNGEERWEYCDAILRDLGKSINRTDPDLVELMKLLAGHPLAMRTVLPGLEKVAAAQVLAAVHSNLARLKGNGDQEQAKLYATLAFVAQSLPLEMRPLLVILGMHEGFVDADYVGAMAKQVDATWTRAKIDALIQALVIAGLLRNLGDAIYEMHPLLTSYLRSPQVQAMAAEDRDKWSRAFVGVMAALADQVTPKHLHEQQGVFHVHGQNFYYGLGEAERLHMSNALAALTQSLAVFAENTRNFAVAKHLFEFLANQGRATDDAKLEATAYHQLGRIAEEERDFSAAEQWYRKSLSISEKRGIDHYASSTYHQLGRIAEEQRDFAAAEQWYRKSLATEEKQGNEAKAAISYGQLGNLSLQQEDFAAANQWYHKCLAITEKHGDEETSSRTYHQLGMVAEEQGDYAAAEQWYRKSLAIKERQGNELGAARTYHQLGNVAHTQKNLAAAEQWYRKSLAIKEKQGDEHAAASTYHQLGMVAKEQGDFTAAEQWYRKSLAIEEKQGNEYGAAITYGQLGIIAGLQHNFLESGLWLSKSIVAFVLTNDQPAAVGKAQNFMSFYKQASPHDQEKLKAIWREAGLGELPDVDDSKS